MNRDFFHVNMIADTIAANLQSTDPVYGTFDLGTGIQTNVADLLAATCDAFDTPYEYVDPPAGTALGNPTHIESFVVQAATWNSNVKGSFIDEVDTYIDILRGDA